MHGLHICFIWDVWGSHERVPTRFFFSSSFSRHRLRRLMTSAVCAERRLWKSINKKYISTYNLIFFIFTYGTFDSFNSHFSPNRRLRWFLMHHSYVQRRQCAESDMPTSCDEDKMRLFSPLLFFHPISFHIKCDSGTMDGSNWKNMFILKVLNWIARARRCLARSCWLVPHLACMKTLIFCHLVWSLIKR